MQVTVCADAATGIGGSRTYGIFANAFPASLWLRRYKRLQMQSTPLILSSSTTLNVQCQTKKPRTKPLSSIHELQIL